MNNSEADNDDCLARASQGDQDARAQLLEQHRDQLKRMVTLRLDRRVLKRVDPMDIIQEALIQANQELDDFVPDLSDESVAELATFLCDLSEEPLRKLLRAEAQARLRDALSQLAERDREILVLRYLEQLSTADTAAILKLGLSAVKMRHLRAIERTAW